MARVLVVGSQLRLVESVRRALSRAGHSVTVAHTLQDARGSCLAPAPDVVILDDAQPSGGSAALIRFLRSRPDLAMIPILLLATPTASIDSSNAGPLGPDACLRKPVKAAQLTQGVSDLLQATADRPRLQELVSGPLRLDISSGSAYVEGVPITLTPVEMRLLLYLIGQAGKPLSALTLLEQVWGYPPGTGSARLVRVHILNLRAKLEADPHNPQLIRTLPKHGYVWSV